MFIKTGIIRYLWILGFVAIFAAPLNASAQKAVGIAAIVNDRVISNIDLQERVKIAIFASNLPKGKGLEEKLLPQILRNLVDERLYMAEASRLGVEVTKDEMDRVVTDIEERNHIKPGKLQEYLEANGISQATMIEQIKSQLTWNKVIARRIRPKIIVTSKEVDEKMEYVSRKSGKEEVNIAEILLVVDSPADNKKIKEIADKLVKQLRAGGDFDKIAKQFSKASSAEKGGDIGWVRAGQLPDEVSQVVKSLRISDVSDAVQTPQGYIILKLKDRRSLASDKPEELGKISLRRAFVTIEKGASASDVDKIQEKIKKNMSNLKSCNDLLSFTKDLDSRVYPRMELTQISKLSPEVISLVHNLKIGELSKPARVGNGFDIFMVCERQDSESTLALRNKIREGLMMKKLEIQANRYLRDLHRGAFIEVRM